MWARLLSAALGIWLMAAPAILGYGGVAANSDRIAGPIATSFAIVATAGATRPLRWMTIPVGVWLLVGPWILNFPTQAIVNDTVVGLLMIALAFVRGTVSERFGGGWSTLLPGHRAPEGERSADSAPSQ